MGLCLPSKVMIKFLEAHEFEFVRSNGTSHRIYSNGKVTLPVSFHGNDDLTERIIRRILRESGLSKKQLLKWLGR